tara:strand:- start:711 stop:1310 length:600 start_codon:yes stop_codon:yes gene_type:complete
MTKQFKQALLDSIKVKESLLDNGYIDQLKKIGDLIISCIKSGNKVMFCGNGGSAADAQHLVAEMLVRLRPKINRQALPAISLTLDVSTITACGNDFGFVHLFERNVQALGRKGDLLICISTSGMSKNIELATKAAINNKIISIGLLGNQGGMLKDLCNESIIIPSQNTARIQECHITLGHALIEYVEDQLLEDEFISIN